MPVAMIALSVVLQAGCFGYLSGRLTANGSLLLSFSGFACSALLFTALAAVRRRRRRAAVPSGTACGGERRAVRRLLWLMNAVTAVTFLSFYVALAWVPATLASGVETALGPLALAVLSLLPRSGHRSTARDWCLAAVLAAAGGALAWRLNSGTGNGGSPLADGDDWTGAAGITLVVVAGAGASALALISKSLGARGADPVTVTAHRFHATYLGAAALFVLRGGSPYDSGIPLPVLPLVGIAAVTLPLFVLQVGLQRANPMAAMVVLTTLPGMTALSEALWTGHLDPLALALTTAMVLLATANATGRGKGNGNGTGRGKAGGTGSAAKTGDAGSNGSAGNPEDAGSPDAPPPTQHAADHRVTTGS